MTALRRSTRRICRAAGPAGVDRPEAPLPPGGPTAATLYAIQGPGRFARQSVALADRGNKSGWVREAKRQSDLGRCKGGREILGANMATRRHYACVVIRAVNVF